MYVHVYPWVEGAWRARGERRKARARGGAAQPAGTDYGLWLHSPVACFLLYIMYIYTILLYHGNSTV